MIERKYIKRALIKSRDLMKERESLKKEIGRVERLAKDELKRLRSLEKYCKRNLEKLTISEISEKYDVPSEDVSLMASKLFQ